MNTIIPPVQSNVNVKAPSTTSLKRTRSTNGDRRQFNTSRVPPLPPINNDLLLQVFTHKSLRRPNVSPNHYGDNERLSDLGETAFELTMTNILFGKRPFLNASEIAALRDNLLSSGMLEDWVSCYRFRSKLRCHPDIFSTLKSPEETKSIFDAYVGAVFLTSGLERVNEWISGLLGQEFETLDEFSESHTSKVITPPPKRAKSETLSTQIFRATSSSPARELPARFPSGSTNLPNPLSPAQPSLPFLPLFNQAAMKRRVTVEYLAEYTGPSHAGRWLVKCIVNGICKGEGTGGNKNVAKEEAARKAYYSMGWT